MSNTRILRERQADAGASLDRTGTIAEDGGLSTLVQTTTQSTYPTSASAYFACRPILVDGPEHEGAAASFTPDPTRVFHAFNLGTQLPPLGTKLVVTCCGGCWVFRFDG